MRGGALRSFAMGGHMKVKKLVAVLAIASMAFGMPSMASPSVVHVSSGGGVTPWPAIGVMIGVAGVMINAAYVWNTQCRELSTQEAITSTFLPIIGMAFNAQASRCH